MEYEKNSLSYVTFNWMDKIKIRRNLKKYNFIITNTVDTKYKSINLMYGCTFLHDIKKYYNIDLALTASICNSLPLNRKTEKKICYHLENFYFRLIACWDYIFIALNEYLHTELISSWDIKQKIIEGNSTISFPSINEEGYIQILKLPLPEEERKDIEKKLNKELKVLTPKNLKDAISKKYEMTIHIKQIFELYDAEKALQQAKSIRNSIIHSDSLTKDFNFDVSDLFKSQVISSKNINDIASIIDLVLPNMEILKKAISLLNEMITLDIFPNRIENSSEEYFIQLVKCKECEKEYIYTADFVETLDHNPYCLFCNSEKNTELIEKVKVSEPYYEQVFLKFYEDLMEYSEQDSYYEDLR
ncbi:hypothetical protein ACTHPF_13160 [Paenibacillus sp. SAF-054]|uniref:hypothetical protein n=1 Tax=unclassified Paenibacillus TaxID=185978 RepID=UPI003F81C4D2